MTEMYRGKRVLTIGARAQVLKAFSEALRLQGFEAVWTNEYKNPALVLNTFNARNFEVVAFGRGVGAADKALLRQRFAEQHPQIRIVEGLAPIPALLADQVKLACKPNGIEKVKVLARPKGSLQLEVLAATELLVKQYHLGYFFQTFEQVIFKKTLATGAITIPYARNWGRNFLVISQPEQVVEILKD